MKTKCPKFGEADSWAHHEERPREGIPNMRRKDEEKWYAILIECIKKIHTESPAKYTPSQITFHSEIGESAN